jgi:hypothetical protein
MSRLARIARRHRILDRFSYANVIATIALFVSLGGASYAAIELPAGSVGARQLRRGAVTAAALGFPLAVGSFTNQRPLDLPKSECNSPLPPGVAPPPCPLELLNPASFAHLSLASHGRLLVTTIVDLTDRGPEGTSAQVELGSSLDGHVIADAHVTVGGGQELQVPLQGLAEAAPGTHAVGFGALARSYSSRASGDAIVSSVSSVVTELPSQ